MLAPRATGRAWNCPTGDDANEREGVEERRGEAGPHARQHRAVQIGGVVEPVERAVVDVRSLVGGRGDGFVGEQIQIDVRSQLPDPLAALDPVVGAVGGHRQVLGA